MEAGGRKLELGGGLRKLEVQTEPPSKLESHPRERAGAGSRESGEVASIARVAVLIRVSQPGYVPPGVEVRTCISSELFSADVPESLLPALSKDPLVVSVGVSQPLGLVEPRSSKP